MQRSLNSIVGLIAYLAIFFNLGRIAMGDIGLIDIQLFVFALATLAVILIIIIPFLRRQEAFLLIVGWGLIYILLKLSIFNTPPLIGNNYTYISFTELSLLLIAVFLAHLFAKNMVKLEHLMETV